MENNSNSIGGIGIPFLRMRRNKKGIEILKKWNNILNEFRTKVDVLIEEAGGPDNMKIKQTGHIHDKYSHIDDISGQYYHFEVFIDTEIEKSKENTETYKANHLA